jgi:hypothetical protein
VADADSLCRKFEKTPVWKHAGGFFFNGELKMENGELAGASRDILHFQFSILH